MQDDAALGVHFTLVIKAEGLLWLAKQRGALALIVVKRQTTATQGFQGQLPGFFRGIRPQLR
ncbi:hypothetical protein TU77_16915 [Pseudomonas synxantha]|uniref:Uncharacterized protein n=1 Tax=Pseudomonas synxantha TaxID=47883 RepID=A0ABS0USK1_9PSED|nr:hypothetical protein TU77_16915 [Pseudomonas synxantha]MBI6568572.1 hypothetical protein [Pseudomonas synxantha]MBI6584445.1 hypothetical protein [Pseudomonas synxantha]MBI6646633.1 hypothetical protein [Pseudomonas synxantha]